jgi:hypothetical protein
MSDEYWDNSPEEERLEDNVVDEGAEPFVFVNGSRIYVDVGASFKDSISSVAKEAGLGKFRVVLNGEDVLPVNAPELISEGDKVELLKYDIAG